jgi:hypothetical protein
MSYFGANDPCSAAIVQPKMRRFFRPFVVKACSCCDTRHSLSGYAKEFSTCVALQFDFHFLLDSELFPTCDQIPPFPGLVSLIDHLSANHRPNHLRGPKLLRRHGKNVTIH